MAGDELLIRSGQRSGRRIAVEGEVVLGRETAGSVLDADPELSRRHAKLFRDDHGRLVVEDLGSANGTLVNGQRIRSAQVLQPGDRVLLGATELEVRQGENQTLAVALPPAQRVGPQPAAPSQPWGPGALPGGPPPGSPDWTVGGAQPSGGGRKVLIVAVVLVVIAALGVGGFFLFSGDNSRTAGNGVDAASDCGAKLGGGQPVAMVAYVEGNTKKANSVLAIPYRAGDMAPLPISQCATGGTGSADLTDSGVLDANNQVILNADKTMLFAVNQGSDTIAVYRVAPNGALTAVPGSPFPSGGKAPSSLGLSGNTLVVANKTQDGVRDLSTEKPVYTTLRVESDGRLTPIAGSSVTADPGSSPTDAYVPPQGGVAFSTEESGPLRSFSIGSDGVLTQAPGSPQDIDSSVFANGFDPKKKFALGIVSHPTKKLLYVSLPTIPALSVYSYGDDGKLTFERAILNSGAYLPCWNLVTPDGKWLYTINADTNNVTAFSLDDPKRPQQIQTLPFDTPGNPWNGAIDKTGQFLTVNTPRDTLKVPEGEGNTQHLLRIGNDGKLTEVGKPVKLPVPTGTNPQGLAVLNVG